MNEEQRKILNEWWEESLKTEMERISEGLHEGRENFVHVIHRILAASTPPPPEGVLPRELPPPEKYDELLYRATYTTSSPPHYLPQDAERELATAADLANTWARGAGVDECENPWKEYELRNVIERLWDRTSSKIAGLQKELAGAKRGTVTDNALSDIVNQARTNFEGHGEHYKMMQVALKVRFACEERVK